ncbi:MAG: SUMF1/EgtB/PvdO family nonheme iron enzyme [bacterium]
MKSMFYFIPFIIIFASVLFSAVPATAAPWQGEPTRLDVLVAEIQSFVAEEREKYSANEGFLKTVEDAANLMKDTCERDYSKFLETLEEFAQEAGNEQTMEPNTLERFYNIFKTDLMLRCPLDMVLIEGTYCIDRHEYPGAEGESPLGGVLWSEAGEKCEVAGKRLCTEKEWFRACSGPPCVENSFPESFNSGECGATFAFEPPKGEWKIKDREQCMSIYGVDDLAGGIWEWVADEYRVGLRILRSGALPNESQPSCDKSSWLSPDVREPYAGFRCCAQPVIAIPQEGKETQVGITN